MCHLHCVCLHTSICMTEWLVGWLDWLAACVHRYRLPETETPREAAYQIISDELMLDGNPRLNLASFVTTWMEPECDKLILSALNKNYIDMDEYPITTEFQVLSSGSLNPTITEDMGNQ